MRELNKLVKEGWLKFQKHPEADLWIYNYTPKCQYERHWNEFGR